MGFFFNKLPEERHFLVFFGVSTANPKAQYMIYDRMSIHMHKNTQKGGNEVGGWLFAFGWPMCSVHVRGRFFVCFSTPCLRMYISDIEPHQGPRDVSFRRRGSTS
jgi:hypothetical protein